MPVTEALQTMGRWSLTLKEGTPKFIRDAVSTPWQHIVITPSWVDIAGMSDDDIVANALYTGVVLQPGPQYEIGGVGNLWWLGDERGVPHLTSPVTSGVGSSSLSTWVTSVLALTPIDVGTVTGAGPVGGTVRAAFTYQSARVALEAIFKYFQVEYRVNNDWTIDYGEAADLYGTDPIATALPRGQGGREFNLKGFRVTDLDYSRDFTDVLSHVTAAGRGGNGTATGIVPATDFSAYDREGGNIVRRAFFDVPEAALGFETNYAESIIARYSDVDFVGVSTDDFVRSQFSPGYLINVYDADRGLQDGDNQDFYQGEILFPKLVRVIGMQWPIQEGCGVYYRYHAATVVGAVTYTDLTPYVEWERPGTKIETGNPAYSPINEQFSVSAQTATVSAGTWDTYTPTITGAGTAVGSGTVVGFFRRIGTTLQIRITWTLAAGSTVGAGGVTFSMPTGITAVTQTNVFQMVEAMYNDTGTAVYHGHAYVGSGGTTLLCNVHAYNGAAAGVAYVTWAPLAAAVPHIWAATDFINLNGTIEVAP